MSNIILYVFSRLVLQEESEHRISYLRNTFTRVRIKTLAFVFAALVFIVAQHKLTEVSCRLLELQMFAFGMSTTEIYPLSWSYMFP